MSVEHPHQCAWKRKKMEKRKVILTQSSSSWFLFCVRRGKCCLGNGQEKVNRDLYANWCYFRRTTTSGFHTKWKTSLYPFKHLYNIIIKIFPPFGLSQSICVHVGIIITDMKTIFYTFKWIMYFVNYTHTHDHTLATTPIHFHFCSREWKSCEYTNLLP